SPPRCAIRRRCVDKVLRLGVLALFPDDGPVTRPPLPSAGSSRDEFPDFTGTMRDSDSCRPVSPDSCARPTIPPLRLPFAPAPPRRRWRGPGGFGSAPPQPTKDGGEQQASPVAGEPWWTFALFLGPGRTLMPGCCGTRTRSLRSFRRWTHCEKLDCG